MTALSQSRNYFNLSLKTKLLFGLIFYIGQLNDTHPALYDRYLSLTVNNGYVEFSYKLQSNRNAIILKSKQRIDDGQWHRIEIRRIARYATLKIDNENLIQKIARNIKRSSNLTFDSDGYLYMGGYRRLCVHYPEHYCQPFQGCIQSFRIDKRHLNMIQDEKSIYTLNKRQTIRTCEI
ncbi:unnamed protein product [Didymodactylos carnosus]|uniref:Laminin G domain-containing protein n=1 Tax=Didymodactylos carnosus TaxID=1234261 RepID=A0A814JJN5_9BILA|nr:unnamed protein product [Didymodactylos carnosus]CAF1523027.1 unnamed protein product [Didymodactylos carnosus]CAF3809025.1 unnamed protein product [Didymodactylos carnosus]CAF4309828.1 unnamed protein product [Didymodactylos carnosus]